MQRNPRSRIDEAVGVSAWHPSPCPAKFQLSIPKAVREEPHLQAGQRFAVITKGDIISLVPIPELSKMHGIAKGADTSDYRDRTADGDRVILTESAEGGYRLTAYDPEFEQQMQAAEEGMQRYRNTLKALSE